MKTLPTILLVSTLLALPAASQAQQAAGPRDMMPSPDKGDAGGKPKGNGVKYALIMPDDKTAERVKNVERNPFGRNDDDKKGFVVKTTNEENVIRELLLKLRVVGASPDEKGMRVMLGDMILSADQVVPTLLPDQTLTIKVGRITPEFIELVWVEKKSTNWGLPPRKLVIPMDLRPKVRYQLQGQDLASKKSKATEAADVKMGQQAEPGLTQVLPEVAKANGTASAAAGGEQTAKLGKATMDPGAEAAPEDGSIPAPANASGTVEATGTGSDEAPMAPLKKVFDLFNALTKPVSDRQ